MLSGDVGPADRLADLLGLECSSRVLHVPCGGGEAAVRMAWRLGCRVVGVDPSQDNVETATERAREEGVDSLCTFVQGAAPRIDLGDGSFDAVICELPLGSLPGETGTARELSRLLRSSGRLAMVGPHPEEVAAFVRTTGLERGPARSGDTCAAILATKP